jgi:hypothetical protein
MNLGELFKPKEIVVTFTNESYPQLKVTAIKWHVTDLNNLFVQTEQRTFLFSAGQWFGVEVLND